MQELWNSNNNTPSIAAHSQQSIDLNLPVSMPATPDLQAELRYNIDFCAANKLTQTQKWLSELLVAVPPSTGPAAAKMSSKVFYEEPCPETDQLKLGRSLFELKEFKKCAYVL